MFQLSNTTIVWVHIIYITFSKSVKGVDFEKSVEENSFEILQ